MSAYQEYQQTRCIASIPSLKAFYADDFRVGFAVAPHWMFRPEYDGALRKHASTLTAENCMKPMYLLDRAATLAAGSADRAVLSFAAAAPVLDYARDNGIGLRFHTLVWHNQTPRWFFAQDWSDAPDTPLADRNTMIARLRNSIADTMDYVNRTWPGVVYAWDAVNEAIEPEHQAPNCFRTKSLWYQTLGEDFVTLAFRFARQHQAVGQKLYYNDYNVAMPDKTPAIRALVCRLHAEGLVDGVGFQTHIGVDYPDFADYEHAVRDFAAMGLTIQATEVDVRMNAATPAAQMKLAVRYRDYFAMMRRLRREGVDIDSITLWGMTDDHGWLMPTFWNGPNYPLLFDGLLRPKAAFFGALLDEAIPARMEDVTEPDVLPPEDCWKPAGEHNPVMTQRFGADPWAMVYGDRVYLYMTGDFYEYADDGSVGANHYGSINKIRCISSADLVNWTDHGDIAAAGPHGAAKWARNSWAPAAAHKVIDGKEQFFLYFADSGNGIGVLQADAPWGPFRDPLGHALINRDTPTCAEVTWLFDPAVLVDEDGQGYIYVGGGVPEGRAADPGTARCVRLGADMISIDGIPQAICPPYLFEDSGINRVGDKYVYSYCTNFTVPADAPVPFTNGEICTMIGDSPLGPFTFADRVLKNPEAYFGTGGNNHHCMFQFHGQWYIAYHTQTLERTIGVGSGYRCTFIDRIDVAPDGRIALATGTMAGVPQVKAFNPYAAVPAATAARLAGMTTHTIPGGQVLYSQVAQSWVMLSQVDFGQQGATSLSLRYASACDCPLSLLLDDVNAAPAAALTLPHNGFYGPGMEEITLQLPQPLTGVHDLYFLFGAPTVRVAWWQFR